MFIYTYIHTIMKTVLSLVSHGIVSVYLNRMDWQIDV